MPDLLEDQDGQFRLLGLHQAISQDTQERTVLQIHFRQVREHAHGEFGLTLVKKGIGHIKVKRRAILPAGPFVEIDGVELLRVGRLQARNVGSI